MVMGQEERKNKAKLEKTQIQLASTSSEYEAAVKLLEETTGRWNKEWKAACDVCCQHTGWTVHHDANASPRNSKTWKKSGWISQKAVCGATQILPLLSA